MNIREKRLAQNSVYSYGRHEIDHDDLSAVVDCLSQDYLSQGPFLESFEERMAEYLGARHCIAVSSGTAGLHIAGMSLGLNESSVVLTTPLTFVATANSIRHTGARLELVDIDPKTLNMDPNQLEQRIARVSDCKPSAKLVVPVHFAGVSCDMRSIGEIASAAGCNIVEDGAHALGGEYGGNKVGSCEFSDATVFSFHPVKSITTGEGGIVATNKDELSSKLRLSRSHGVVPGVRNMEPWVAEMITDGLNYRISEIQAALGISQLRKLDKFVSYREKLVDRYRKNLSDLEFQFQEIKEQKSANHILPIQLPPHISQEKKLQIYQDLKLMGLNLAVHYLPIHLHSFYKKTYGCADHLPNAEEYYRRAFSLPLYTKLALSDVDEICDRLYVAVH